MTSEEDFAPIWEESILLEEHEAVQASVDVGGWLSAALDDPNVCDQMKADINRWFSAGFLYLDNVRQLMQADREAVRAEQAAEVEKLTLTVRKLQGHQAALESYLREIRDKPVARSSDAWKRHCLKLQAIAAEALGDVA